MAHKVSVVIVTFHREQFLRRTVLSCFAQRDVDLHDVEIVVVDGSQTESARPVVQELQEEAARLGLTLRYLNDSRPGISHSRNTGAIAAAAPLVAFIDDDEEAEPHWLARLLDCQGRFAADVVVGPVYPMFELDSAARDPYWRWYFTADSRQSSGEIAKWGAPGTHNCLFVKRTCCVVDEPFDPALGLTGGEDMRFFHSVVARGGKVVWCADAIINEFIPAARSRWSYALRRQLRESQLHMQAFLWSGRPDLGKLAWWMAVGCAQVAVYTPLTAICAVFDRSLAKRCGTKLAGGIGKLLWFPGITLVGYGDRGPKQTPARA